MQPAVRSDVARLAWQLRAVRWGGRGGSGYLHSDFAGYAERPLSSVHAALVRCIHELQGRVQSRRLAVFEAFYGLTAPPMEAQVLAELFGLSPEGVRHAVRAVESLILERLPRQKGRTATRLRPAVFEPRQANALPAIVAALTEAVGDEITIAALDELRARAEPGWRDSAHVLQQLSRMERLRARRRASQLAGYHQQRIDNDRKLRALIPTPRRLWPAGRAGDLEQALAEYSDVLPTDHDTAIHELTRKAGPNLDLVIALTATANNALVGAERDIEPLLSVIAAQFARDGSELDGDRAVALASVQAVRTALARELEDLSSLHYADSVLRLVGPFHPLGQQALREAALTLRAHKLFSAANACLRELASIARQLRQEDGRDVAVGQLYSHRVGLTLSVARAHAIGGQPPAPASLAELLSGTIAAADQIARHDPDGQSIGLVATLHRRAAELAFTWPEVSQSRQILAKTYGWANEFQDATARLGKLQWCRTAMTVALQVRDEEAFVRWDKRAEALAIGAPWHFTVLHEINDLRVQSQRLGLSRGGGTQPPRLIVASTSDLARLSRYTARPERSGSELLLRI